MPPFTQSNRFQQHSFLPRGEESHGCLTLESQALRRTCCCERFAKRNKILRPLGHAL
jgi:hypothetical protein